MVYSSLEERKSNTTALSPMKLVIANFKSHKTPAQYQEWVKTYASYINKYSQTSEVALAPAYPSLSLVANEAASLPATSLAVQDISPFPAGAYTGAVNPLNLDGLHVKYAIVGHSERRQYFHETSQEVANKVHEALAAGITPIVCVTKDQVMEQANAIESNERSKILVAFEPIEHIGTGISDSPENIEATKELVIEAFGNVPYIYGGSVNEKTEKEILTNPNIDGFLVGSASLDAVRFEEVLAKI